MSKKVIWKILGGLFPVLLLTAGKDDGIAKFLLGWAVDDIEPYQGPLFIVGLVWTGGLHPWRISRVEKKAVALERANEGLERAYKSALFLTLGRDLGNVVSTLRTRIFVQKKDWLSRLKRWICTFRWWKDTPQFINLTDISPLTDPFENGELQFEVSPTPEGIVGNVFVNQELVIDDNLDNNRTYRLSDRKRRILGNVQFCAAIPILADAPVSGKSNGRGKVLAVLSVESEQRIPLDVEGQKNFANFMISYATFWDSLKKLK